jgi:hypothetical protein
MREAKKFSQGDMEKRTGLVRCDLSESKTAIAYPHRDAGEAGALSRSSAGADASRVFFCRSLRAASPPIAKAVLPFPRWIPRKAGITVDLPVPSKLTESEPSSSPLMTIDDSDRYRQFQVCRVDLDFYARFYDPEAVSDALRTSTREILGNP